MAKYRQIVNSKGEIVNCIKVLKSTPPLAKKPAVAKSQNVLAELKTKMYSLLRDIEHVLNNQRKP